MTTKRHILIAVALSAFCAPQMYADKNDTLAEKNYAAKQEMPTYVKTFQAGTISDLEAMINAYAHKLNKIILSASITSNKDSSLGGEYQYTAIVTLASIKI